MVANAVLATLAIVLAIGFFLLGELKFFIPLKVVVWRVYSTYISLYVGTLFTNIFAAAYAVNRKFLLKDTGRKLSHLDKQFNVGHVEFPTSKDELEPPADVPLA